jgi:hypothetical protein
LSKQAPTFGGLRPAGSSCSIALNLIESEHASHRIVRQYHAGLFFVRLIDESLEGDLSVGDDHSAGFTEGHAADAPTMRDLNLRSSTRSE